MEIRPNIFSCGVQDPQLRVFDIIMSTPHGTSYNAFIVKGEEKTALIEAVKSPFWDEYLGYVNAITPIEKADYLIVNHTEPDHAGAIEKLLGVNPNITIVGTSIAIQFLNKIVNKPFQSKAVKAGDTLDLGGKTLTFYPMPNLHWPDTLFTFEESTRTLFSCDVFGAHYSYAPLLYSTMKDRAPYQNAQHQYFLDIMSPFINPFVLNGTKKARELNPSIICTGHGPVLDVEIQETFNKYDAWSAQKKNEKPLITIAYVSAYGYTRELAETIQSELEKDAAVEVKMFEVTAENSQDAVASILQSDGFLLGTPTIVGDALRPIMDLLLSVLPVLVKGKVASAFGSYGWSGEGVPNVMARLAQLRVKTIEGLRVRFKPDGDELEQAKQFAQQFLQEVTKGK